MNPAYHTQRAFEARLEERKKNPVPPEPMLTFVHISCMNNWEIVLLEQLRLLAHVGIKYVASYVLGSAEQVERCKEIAKLSHIDLNILGSVDDLTLYEGPTLNALYDWALHYNQGAIFYIHTKGVSHPDDDRKGRWRRVMMHGLFNDWKGNLQELATHDILGSGWCTSRDFPHFPGNFWAARCDWITSLDRPSEYRMSRNAFNWAGYSWRDRMYVETWLGSKNFHHVKEKVWHNAGLWQGDDLWKIPFEIPGFLYVDPEIDYSTFKGLCIDLGGGTDYGCCDYLNVDWTVKRGKGLRINFEKDNLPFADNSVDAIHSAHCFEHIVNLRGLLKEMMRVCRVGARVYLRLPHWLHPMAMCHDHKQVIPPEQIDHWCNNYPPNLEYWWKGSKKRLSLKWTRQKPSAFFTEAKSLFPHLSDDQLMRFIPSAAQEVEYLMEVVPHDG